jgi:hypothetical protein
LAWFWIIYNADSDVFRSPRAYSRDYTKNSVSRRCSSQEQSSLQVATDRAVASSALCNIYTGDRHCCPTQPLSEVAKPGVRMSADRNISILWPHNAHERSRPAPSTLPSPSVHVSQYYPDARALTPRLQGYNSAFNALTEKRCRRATRDPRFQLADAALVVPLPSLTAWNSRVATLPPVSALHAVFLGQILTACCAPTYMCMYCTVRACLCSMSCAALAPLFLCTCTTADERTR